MSMMSKQVLRLNHKIIATPETIPLNFIIITYHH